MDKERMKLIISAFVLMLLGAFLGFYFERNVMNDRPFGTALAVRENNKSYFYTNPLLECELSSTDSQFVLTQKKMKEVVSNLQHTNLIPEISVYFRDLNNGPWFGINQDADFAPASLLKVPILIAYLKESQVNPPIMEQVIKIASSSAESALPENVSPKSSAVVGKEYKVKSLLDLMIKYSDNIAANSLASVLPVSVLEDTFRRIGTSYRENGQDVVMSVREYATFFRILFNASYLDQDHSEQALKLLSETDFNNGIVKGIDGEVTVSHKFGERNNPGRENPIQMHDCGIVYYPDHPYLLCIMTRGKSIVRQEKFIQDVSRAFYQEVKNQSSI